MRTYVSLITDVPQNRDLHCCDILSIVYHVPASRIDVVSRTYVASLTDTASHIYAASRADASRTTIASHTNAALRANVVSRTNAASRTDVVMSHCCSARL